MKFGTAFVQRQCYHAAPPLTKIATGSANATMQRQTHRGKTAPNIGTVGPLGGVRFFEKSVPMQRENARREFGARALPCHVFQWGFAVFVRVVACLALSRFAFRVRGRPHHFLKFCFPVERSGA